MSSYHPAPDEPYGGRPIPRYSPRPSSSYVKILGLPRMRVRAVGVGADPMLQRNVCLWNLVWLSHDFEAHVQHPDPYVVRVMQDLLAQERILTSWLCLPAPAFVHRVMALDPEQREDWCAFKMYGPEWLDTMQARAPLAQPPVALDPDLDRVDLPIAVSTRRLLERIGRVGHIGNLRLKGLQPVPPKEDLP